MKTTVDILMDIPCFKCLFWDEKRESHLNCNPNECEQMTDWIFKEIEKDPCEKENLIVVTARSRKAKVQTVEEI